MSPSDHAALEIMVSATPQTRHDLTPFDPLPSGGYQPRCRRTVWPGPTALIYRLLSSSSPV